MCRHTKKTKKEKRRTYAGSANESPHKGEREPSRSGGDGNFNDGKRHLCLFVLETLSPSRDSSKECKIKASVPVRLGQSWMGGVWCPATTCTLQLQTPTKKQQQQEISTSHVDKRRDLSAAGAAQEIPRRFPPCSRQPLCSATSNEQQKLTRQDFYSHQWCKLSM